MALKSITVVAIAIVLLVAGIGAGFVVGFGVYQPQISNLQGQISVLEDDVSSIQGQNSQLQGQVSDLEGNVSDLQNQLQDANTLRVQLESQITNLTGQVTNLTNQNANLSSQITDLQGQISALQAYITYLEGLRLTGNITIGSLQPLTGDLATYGQNSRVAIDLAVEEVNAFLQEAGANWSLKILTEDTATDPAVALTKLESLHAKGIKFVIGPMSSSEVANIKGYADANEILVVSQSSTRPGLNTPDDFLFRFSPTDLIQGPAIARIIADDNVTKVIAVYRNDAWGKGLHDATKARFEGLGGIFLTSLSYDPSAPAFPALAATLNTEVTSAIATYGADKVGVLYIGFEEVVAFFTECSVYSSTGWGVKWYGSDGTTLSGDMIADTTVADFSYQTGYINPIFSPTRSDKYQKVYDEGIAKLGRAPDAYAYIAYDIVWVLALSLLTVDAYDSGAVRAVLPTVAQNYFGASGWIVLNADGDRAFADYDLWVITKVDTTYQWKMVGKYIFATDSITWL